MRKLLVIFMVLCFSVSYAGQFVEGYFRSDGTYVAPHYRSNPDGYKWNNYSTKGNINPYTGKRGTKNPYDFGNNFNTDFGSDFDTDFGSDW